MLVSQTSFGVETSRGSMAKCQLFSQASMLTLVTLSALFSQAVMLKKMVWLIFCVFSLTAYGNNTTKDNASENFFCDVCSKKLNGPIPYKMHLNSKAHKEEVALREEFGYWWLLYQTDIFLTYNAKDSTVCSSVQIWEKFPLASSSGSSCWKGR